MKTGEPPTAPKARAGLFTPPGMARRACSKAAALRGRLTRCGVFVAVMTGVSVGGSLFGRFGQTARQPGGLLGYVLDVGVGVVAVQLREFLQHGPGGAVRQRIVAVGEIDALF